MKKNEMITPSKPKDWFSVKGTFKKRPFEKKLFLGAGCLMGLLVVFSSVLIVQINSLDTFDLFLNKKDMLNSLVFFMVILLGAGMLFLLVQVYYGIIVPIKRSEMVLKKLADGNLEEAVSLYASDNVSEVGNFIRELTINFQEFLLLIWNLTEASKKNVESALTEFGKEHHLAHSDHSIENRLKSVDMNLKDMKSVIRTFQLYGVDLNDEKPVMDDETHLK